MRVEYFENDYSVRRWLLPEIWKNLASVIDLIYQSHCEKLNRITVLHCGKILFNAVAFILYCALLGYMPYFPIIILTVSLITWPHSFLFKIFSFLLIPTKCFNWFLRRNCFSSWRGTKYFQFLFQTFPHLKNTYFRQYECMHIKLLSIVIH